MDDLSDSAYEHAPTGLQNVPRRTLRKGTHSCIECKRRKTRCFFDNSATVCIGCQRRGLKCIGQEFMDVPARSGEGQDMAERLKRVEQLLEGITSGLAGQSIRQEAQYLTADSTEISPDNIESMHDEGQIQTDVDSAIAYPWMEYAETCRALHALLPSQNDADTLISAGRSTIYLQALCNPYSELFQRRNVQESIKMSAIPSVSAHPAVLARKLLHLALCIQQLDPSFDASTLRLGYTPRVAMDKYFQAATMAVTCHDNLVDSVEGLECLLCEGVYLVNCGNLRRALASLRRASTLAQFMGLHRPKAFRVLKQLDAGTHISCEVTWIHIAYLERYLSLLLGMPTSIMSATFAPAEKSACETDSEWIEKVQIDICKLIIQRNQGYNDNLATTQRIDQTLTEVATSIPADWWSPLNYRPGMDAGDVMSKVISMQMQIVHYNLLVILHLPYMLRNSTDSRFDYNKMTGTYASREVLSRYITFRSVVRVVYCCRPVDFCAFAAAMTLLLVHMNEHQPNSGGLLGHQRQGDRALIERTITMLDELNELNNDELSRETAQLARKLLDIEADIAQGGERYSSSISKDGQNEANQDFGQSFYLDIPYFGTVRLDRDVPLPADIQYVTSTSSSSYADHWSTASAPAINLSFDPHFTPSQTDASHRASPTTEHALKQYHDQHGVAQFMKYHPVAANQDKDMDMPDLMATAEDWAFQGVDTTFFQMLTVGLGAYQGISEDQWFSFQSV
ncbi:uncharacterized protein V1518DRAFT_423675 [Limtongia smithiae]|uniref:uncharacterized protein n=1 Tax=Limtongia smithiae TaxID=1125753 RepID=UPI0034CDCBB6